MTEDLISSWSSTDNLGKIDSISVTDHETITENLIWSISSQASHGVAVIDADGENLIYMPDAIILALMILRWRFRMSR